MEAAGARAGLRLGLVVVRLRGQPGLKLLALRLLLHRVLLQTREKREEGKGSVSYSWFCQLRFRHGPARARPPVRSPRPAGRAGRPEEELVPMKDLVKSGSPESLSRISHSPG
jgi:hypothetical protein